MKFTLMYLILIVIFIMTTLVKADTVKIGGNIDISNLYCKSRTNDGKMHESNVKRLDTVLNIDYYLNDKVKFVLSPSYFFSDPIYNNIIKQMVPERNYFYLTEAYVRLDIDNDNYLTLGVINFSKGSFYEYSFNGLKEGNGLFNIIDLNLQGFLWSRKLTSTSYFSLGYLTEDKWIETDTEDTDYVLPNFRNFDNSEMLTFIYKNRLGRNYFEFNFFGTKSTLLGKHVLDNDLMAFGYSYNNEDITGEVYYFVLAFSRTYGTTEILEETPTDPRIELGFVNDSGYSLFFGYKKELDRLIFNRDNMIGVEIQYQSDNFYSLNRGKPNSMYGYGNNGLTINAHAGVRYNRNTLFKIRYCYFNKDNSVNKIGITPITNVEGVFVDNIHAVMLQLYYNF